MTTLEPRPAEVDAPPPDDPTRPLAGPTVVDDPVADARYALDAAVAHLRGLQAADGWWKGELETNVTMDAEDVLLRHFLGTLTPEVAGAAARWIRSQQQPDGPWATFHGGPGDVSATVEAYVALRLAGDQPEAPHMAAASAWARAHGGIDAARVFTRIWLAMVGAFDWERLPVLPAEVMLLPPSAPLNIYDFGCWARQTIVALTVVMAHRPARALPFPIDELRSPTPPAPHRHGLVIWGRAFHGLDWLLHRYERLPKGFLPRRLLRAACLAAAERWIIARQEADGCWGGIQPPIVYSVIALHLQGYALDHPVMKAALAGIEGFVLDDERGRRIEACQSPVWDTALAVVALADAGVAPDDPALDAASRWLVDEEITVRGDWSVRRPDLAPGGWAFEFANDLYPDTDDTAEVVLALRRAGARPFDGSAADAAARRAVAWTLGMQCRDGGWGAFDVDNDSRWPARLPFCDFGEVTDYPTADVTAHVVEMLADEPAVPPDAMRRAVDWLWGQQEADGSWWGRWGTNFVYGTGAAVPALVRAGADPADPRIRRAVAWLEAHQNADGGWGEDMRSYVDPAWRGRGPSTASQTAWALLAVVAAGEAGSRAARRGVGWLVATQRTDGTWDEPQFTGTGFPWDFNINYHLYRLVFPVSALGRWVRAVA
ncbi:MAG TPA: squalene--hopene cyclase [Acidimicrobiales bacterium]|nr:squalene--hopene cyclase [Acidimicrobiales bacterium]